MSLPRVAITLTVGEDDPSIGELVRYHLYAGVDRIFLFFDDPESELADALGDDDRVAVAVCDDELRVCWAEWPMLQQLARHELAARRVLNTELAVQLSRSDGVDWLVQLAPDELIHCDDGLSLAEILVEVADHVGQISFQALEAIPESLDVTHPFEQLTLFKRDPSGAVRSAVRTSLDVRPNARYMFDPGVQELHTMAGAGVRVLRYQHATERAFVRRYATWGALGSGLYGHLPLDQARIDELLAARAAAMAGAAAIARYFRERLVVRDGDELLAAGLCERIDEPRRCLQGATRELD